MHTWDPAFYTNSLISFIQIYETQIFFIDLFYTGSARRLKRFIVYAYLYSWIFAEAFQVSTSLKATTVQSHLRLKLTTS